MVVKVWVNIVCFAPAMDSDSLFTKFYNKEGVLKYCGCWFACFLCWESTAIQTASLLSAQSRSEYSFARFTCCQKFWCSNFCLPSSFHIIIFRIIYNFPPALFRERYIYIYKALHVGDNVWQKYMITYLDTIEFTSRIFVLVGTMLGLPHGGTSAHRWLCLFRWLPSYHKFACTLSCLLLDV